MWVLVALPAPGNQAQGRAAVTAAFLPVHTCHVCVCACLGGGGSRLRLSDAPKRLHFNNAKRLHFNNACLEFVV